MFILLIIYFYLMNPFGGLWIFLLLYFVLDWFYHVFFDIFFRGQSPGKRILGLRVVQNDGSPVSAGASFIRNLLRFVDGYIGLYIIAFLTASVSKAFRRPGDWAAGTLVIYTWQSQIPEQSNKTNWLSGIEPILPKRALSFEEKQGILMFARRYPLLGEARADEIAGPLAASLQNTPEIVSHGAAYLLGIARSFTGDR
ncbi:MAG: RDD family protein [Treponema sp.]|nr:RDD family protein [Treponema sp.]